MSDLISKELLSLVLDKKITAIGDSKRNLLSYSDQLKNPSINLNNIENLDTLGRLFKEWISNQKISVASGKDKEYFCMYRNLNHDETINAESELEAIIKATEQIAKEKGLL